MRLLSIIGVVAYIGLGLYVSQADAFNVPRSELVLESERKQIRMVLNAVEVAAAKGDESLCWSLGAIPIYESSPSTGEWQAFCEAVVKRDHAICGTLPATLQPNIRSLCTSILHS